MRRVSVQEPTAAAAPTAALPGRAKKRKSRSSSSRRSFWKRCYNRWIQGFVVSFSSLFLAVVLWYSLGVVSIGTSKVLLGRGVPPLWLTLQQLAIGMSLLRGLLQLRLLGSQGVQPWSQLLDGPGARSTSSWNKTFHPNLLGAGVFFSLGFAATNYGFHGSSAAFVETLKAAEPLTSAAIAVLWGIEQLSRPEVLSLGTIVAGVLLSTYGHQSSSSSEQSSLWNSLQICGIVLTANLCFSFRGLHQKLLRASTTTTHVDDLNLQYRMQQIGTLLLLGPTVVWHGRFVWSLHTIDDYWLLSLVNGCAFCSYNLASTYILSRISVVHHAALNCLRRIFAIVVTSLLFQVPLTAVGIVGIVVSMLGFLSFTHYKVRKQQQPKPLSSLLPVSAVVGVSSSS